MKTIHLLPENIITQIAAGEVIERPAYAVKELLDNAIDAKATRVTIDLIDSGLSKIIITDNGIGMGKEDILESYKLHTTSKIGKAEHLLAIKSLGFRGEALASISAISTLTIESKPPTEVVGTKIRLNKGELVETTSLGMPSGTRIIVEQLFSNVPARKSFLKSKRTELRHIIETIHQYAFASPMVSFTLSLEGSLSLQIPATIDIADSINMLFGGQIASGLLPITFSDHRISIQGYIIHPQTAGDISPKQYLSVNGRPIDDRLITLAVKEAYGILLENDKQPSFFLSFTLPYEMVDVNVHPRKENVAFNDDQLLFDTITNVVQETLRSHDLSFHSLDFLPPGSSDIPSTRSFLGGKLKESVIPYNTQLLGKTGQDKQCLQIHNLYIVTISSHGMIMIDQHAAHERILYEKYQQQFLIEKRNPIPILLETPQLLELSLSESLILEELLPELLTMGFVVEPFSGTTWKVSNVPEIFSDRDNKKLLMEIISTAQQRSYLPAIDSESKRMLAFLACKTAVKSGDPLTQEQMQDILRELQEIPGAATCPHGRPVKWEISLNELNKLFKRGKQQKV